MSGENALLTFGLGPVHTFLAQARRMADVRAGSYLLSHLIRQAVSAVHQTPGCSMVFPHIPARTIPGSLPNRFVCRVPAAQADRLAGAMQDAVRKAWNAVVKEADRKILREHGLSPHPKIWNPEAADEGLHQAARFLDISWSWVPERDGYARAAAEGARRYAAARMFRPFLPSEERGEKCAICGERTALPDGDREHVRRAWSGAEEGAQQEKNEDLQRYFRQDQGRLCLVCAARRFFAFLEGHRADFKAFDRFQPSDDAPRFALVKMDGDRMGAVLSLGEDEVRGDLEEFHRAVSEALSRFAGGLRMEGLLHSGGDHVLFVCDPRDAIPLVRKLRNLYQESFAEVRSLLRSSEDRFTISAAILFAHPSHPAGLLLRDLEELLTLGAKERAGRNAVALRLAKRSGEPVEVALPWDDAEAPAGGWMTTLEEVIQRLRQGSLTARQTFTLRLEERTLRGVFQGDPERWRPWLADRLSRNEGTSAQAGELAGLVAPFFAHDRAAALRIARFLGGEVGR